MHAPTTNNGPSVFGVMNTCVSRLGSNQLKAWLFQPIRAITDLKRRHLMIEWCRSEKNAVNLTKFRAALKKVVNAGEVYGRLIRSRGKPSIWKVFKRTLYYTNEIADICIALVKSKAPNIEDTVIEKFGKFASDNTEVYDLLRHIDTIIDLDVSTTTGLFSIRPGLDPNLDAKKEQFHTTRDELQVKIKDEIKHLPPTFTELTCHYVAEMGFLIGILYFEYNNFESPFYQIYHYNFKLFFDFVQQFRQVVWHHHKRSKAITSNLHINCGTISTTHPRCAPK